MATVNLGRIKSVWRGTWATGTAYVKDDVVQEGVNSYICVTAHTAGATFAGDSANWDLMAQGAEIPSQSGNAGLALKTDGTNLSWGQAGGMVPLLSYNSSNANVSAINMDNIFTDDYSMYKVFLTLFPSSNQGHVRVRLLRNGATEEAASYRTVLGGLELGSAGGNTTQLRNHYNQNEWVLWPAGGDPGSDTSRGGVNFEFTVFNPRGDGVYPRFAGTYVMTRYQGDNIHGGSVAGMFMQDGGSDFTGLQFYNHNGNTARASISIFGVTGATA